MAPVKRFRSVWSVLIAVSLILVLEYAWERDRSGAPAVESGETVRLHRIIDGDTLDVYSSGRGRIRVRLLGIDCMETYNEDKMRLQAQRLHKNPGEVQHLGKQAAIRLSELSEKGELRLVQPEGFPSEDRYGRTLAYLEVNGRDAAVTLLKEGLAETRREPHPRSSAYRSAAGEAKRRGVGLFGN